MRYSRREIAKMALTALAAASLLTHPLPPIAQDPAELDDQRRAPRHDHLQLSQHARPERGGDAAVRRRLRHQPDRVHGRAGRSVRRRAAARAAAAAAAAASRRRRSSRPRSAKRPTSWGRGARRCRWTGSRRCARCTTTPASRFTRGSGSSPNMSDEEIEYMFNVAEALGCTHTTLELADDVAQLKRIGAFAEKKKIYAAYHTHCRAA